jgi:GT2 family glycosyltransferase
VTNQPKITVVVCSYNGVETLAATLDALDAQTLRGVAEVIVVDDGSTDGTAPAAQRPEVKVISHATNSGLAAARNTGWRAASAPVVAFTDDDCRPREDWLARLVTSFAEHSAAAGIGGAITVHGNDSFATRYLERNNPLLPLEAVLAETPGLAGRFALYLRRSAGLDHAAGTRPVSSLVGANMAFRVDALHRVGGFDERFRFGSEEEDLCRRLQADGQQGPDVGALWFDPTAVVDHDFRPGLGDTLRRSRAYGRGNGRMFLKHTGQNPVVYPLPFAVAGLLLLALLRRRPGLAALAALLPPVLFSRWPRGAIRERNPELLAYPYVQLAQETYGNVGMAETLLRERSQFPRPGAADG